MFFNYNSAKSFIYKKKYVFISLYMKKNATFQITHHYIAYFILDYRCGKRIIHKLFTSTSFHNNSLSRSSISLCITSCFAIYLHIIVPRLSSFRFTFLISSLSRYISDLIPPSLGVGFHCERIRERVKSDRNNFEFG